jgi:hypothetical protein
MAQETPAAGMKLLSALTGRPESYWRPTTSALLSRAMQDFRPTPEGDRNVKRHAVHDRTSFFRSSPSASLYNDSKINRQTAAPQIDDMVRSGQVRAKEFKVKGGNRDTVYWTKGAALPGKESAAYGQTKYIIEANANVADLKRPLSLNEVTIRNQTKPGVWQDITDQVRSAHQAYKKQLANVPQRAANAARGDAAFAGPTAGRAMADDAFTYGMMGGTLGAIPSGFINNARFSPAPTP